MTAFGDRLWLVAKLGTDDPVAVAETALEDLHLAASCLGNFGDLDRAAEFAQEALDIIDALRARPAEKPAEKSTRSGEDGK